MKTAAIKPIFIAIGMSCLILTTACTKKQKVAGDYLAQTYLKDKQEIIILEDFPDPGCKTTITQRVNEEIKAGGEYEVIIISDTLIEDCGAKTGFFQSDPDGDTIVTRRTIELRMIKDGEYVLTDKLLLDPNLEKDFPSQETVKFGIWNFTTGVPTGEKNKSKLVFEQLKEEYQEVDAMQQELPLIETEIESINAEIYKIDDLSNSTMVLKAVNHVKSNDGSSEIEETIEIRYKEK